MKVKKNKPSLSLCKESLRQLKNAQKIIGGEGDIPPLPPIQNPYCLPLDNPCRIKPFSLCIPACLPKS